MIYQVNLLILLVFIFLPLSVSAKTEETERGILLKDILLMEGRNILKLKR